MRTARYLMAISWMNSANHEQAVIHDYMHTCLSTTFSTAERDANSSSGLQLSGHAVT